MVTMGACALASLGAIGVTNSFIREDMGGKSYNTVAGSITFESNVVISLNNYDITTTICGEAAFVFMTAKHSVHNGSSELYHLSV